jgi:ABC-2 type transport system ATP-binding protein
MADVIEAKGLTKQYGEVLAVNKLDLSVKRGEVFGLLGPNGAGKTTTILMILGLTEPTSGSVRVMGYDPSREPLKVKARVGYLPDQVGFYDEMSARDNLRYIASLNRIPNDEADARIVASLKRMGLPDVIDRPVRTFSHGMRQRLGLAELLVKRAELVILDEPTLGLDPEAAREFLVLIRSLKDEGITIMLSSHLLHQVQAICDRVGLFNKGQMVLEGRVRDLAQQVLGGGYRVKLEADGADVLPRLERLPGALRVTRDGGTGHLYVIEADRDLRDEASRAAVEGGGRLLSLGLEEPSLDEVYSHYFKEMAYATA